jgi:ribonuclease HI
MRFIAYTDGACSTNIKVGGWGCVIEIDGLDGSQIKLSGGKKETTNNAMELTAFLEALKFFDGLVEKNKDFTATIYTDSAYISNCFADKWYLKWYQNGWRTSNKRKEVSNIELWKEILELYEKHKPLIQVAKVQGHSNVIGNNIADELAVAAKNSLMED